VGAEIVLFDQHHAPAASSEVAGDADAVYAAADDQHIAVERVSVSLSLLRDRGSVRKYPVHGLPRSWPEFNPPAHDLS
jgi:hypothetical protein